VVRAGPTIIGSREIRHAAGLRHFAVAVTRRPARREFPLDGDGWFSGFAAETGRDYDTNGANPSPPRITENGGEEAFPSAGHSRRTKCLLERDCAMRSKTCDMLVAAGGTRKARAGTCRTELSVDRQAALSRMAYALETGQALCLAVCDGKTVGSVARAFRRSAMFTSTEHDRAVLRRPGRGLPHALRRQGQRQGAGRIDSELGRTNCDGVAGRRVLTD